MEITKVFAVIMAGGRGERFWPLSTESVGKPFLPLLGSTTLIQDTVARLHPLISPERMLVSIGGNHEEIARKQLPSIPPDNFIVEPSSRDTAACLGFCAIHLERRDEDPVMLAVPADQYIENAAAYREAVAKAIGCLDESSGVLFGIRPERPETGYGYVRASQRDPSETFLRVDSFVEKPDAAAASRYLEAGDYFWNSGIFLWRNRTLLRLFETLMPESWQVLDRLRPLLKQKGTADEQRRLFDSLPRISIDYGIVQKMTGLKMIRADFGWDDVGSWSALPRLRKTDEQGNLSMGRHVALDSTGCTVHSDTGMVATFGVSDLVVVQAGGKVLVCSKDRAADLKRLVSAVQEKAGDLK